MEWKTVKKRLSELKPLENNPRKISNENLERLGRDMENLGNFRPLVCDTDLTVLAGNQRYKKLLEKYGGGYEVEVSIPEKQLTEKQKKDVVILDNKHRGEDDIDVLMSEYKDTLEGLGFDDLIPEPVLEVKEDNYEEPEILPSKVKRGEVWQLGRHRLMCGDSTKVDDVERLMNGQKVDMVFTDPPYNGDVANNWDNQWKNWEEFGQFIRGTVFNIDCNLYCVWGNWKSSNAIYGQAIKSNLNFLQEIIWLKPASIGMLNWFPKVTEYMSIFYKKKDLVVNNVENTRIDLEEDFLPKSDLRISMYEKARRGDFDNSSDKRRRADKFVAEHGTKPKNVWYFKNMNGGYGFGSNKNSNEYSEHTTIKPVKLCERGIIAFSRENHLILDLFGGSGSTLIACEQTNRICYMMELDEHYCDVIIDRWEKLTGKKATLIK